MRALTLLPYYLAWHYGGALKNGAAIYRNFVWFIWHFFSIGILLRTLFSPWERMHESPRTMMEFSAIASALLMNLIFRFAGAVMRSAIIFVGLFCIITITAGALIVLVTWLALPVVVVGLLALGLIFLFK